MKTTKYLLAVATGCVVAMTAFQAGAADIEVKMLNKGDKGMFVFSPEFVKANVGDTVHFIAADKGHNAESIEGILPDGAQPFKGEMGKDISVTLDKEGLYGVRCKPHFALGMVALIEAGKPVHEDAVKAAKLPPKVKQKFGEFLAEVDAK